MTYKLSPLMATAVGSTRPITTSTIVGATSFMLILEILLLENSAMYKSFTKQPNYADYLNLS